MCLYLFCPADEITDELIANAGSLHNLMFAVQFDKNTASACEKLRKKKYLYSVYISYQEEDAGMITSGGFLRCTEALHPAFTFFVPDSSCPDYMKQIIYNYIWNARNSQYYQTVPVDLVFDNRAIDSVISDDSVPQFLIQAEIYTRLSVKETIWNIICFTIILYTYSDSLFLCLPENKNGS